MERRPLHYSQYLHLPELLALQQPASTHHDEMLFVVIHQVFELWFKQLLHELDAIRAALTEGRALASLKGLGRVRAIQQVLIQQINVLETMTPVEFNGFRRLLQTASGFQSLQFRELEVLCGGALPALPEALHDEPGWHNVVRRQREATLYEAFLTFLWRQGHPVPEPLLAPGATRAPRPLDEKLPEILKDVYERAGEGGPAYEAFLIAESLVDLDELFLLWRTRHVHMVERTIGFKAGTGGSSGASYLHRTLERKLFPELWAARSLLGH
jgi:tryptophan 2,3-dioxygenase